MRQSAVPGPFGFTPSPQDARVRNVQGADLAKGSVVSLDFRNTKTLVTNNNPGQADSGFANAFVVSNSTAKKGVRAVLLEDIADGQFGNVRISGLVHALVASSDITVTHGKTNGLANANLWLTGSKSFLDVFIVLGNATAPPANVDAHSVAYLLEATGTFSIVDTPELLPVLFDGMHPFAIFHFDTILDEINQ